jgi:hypothetical protein
MKLASGVRLLICLAVVVAALGSSGPALASTANLRIVLWAQGKGIGKPHTWTLRCAPVGGTLPNARRACLRLGSLANPFAPVPANVACSLIYGGPQVALVTGSFRGHLVSTSFKRTDSCQTERWNRVAFLFPSTR